MGYSEAKETIRYLAFATSAGKSSRRIIRQKDEMKVMTKMNSRIDDFTLSIVHKELVTRAEIVVHSRVREIKRFIERIQGEKAAEFFNRFDTLWIEFEDWCQGERNK